jgi:hypothetical protein
MDGGEGARRGAARRHRSGLKLWPMVECVNRNTAAPILTAVSMNGDLQRQFAQLNVADAKMRGIKSLAGRWAFAEDVASTVA